MYYFKSNSGRKRFDDFNNGIELFRKIQTAEYVQIKSKQNTKRKEQIKSKKSGLENFKLLNESREVIIKLLNDYSSIMYEAKYENINGKRISSMLASLIMSLTMQISKYKVLNKCYND